MKVADASAGKYAEIFNYKRKYKKPSLLIHIRRMPGFCFAKLLSFATSIIDALPYKLRMGILVKAPWLMGRLYLSLFNRKKLKEISLVLNKNSSIQKFGLNDSDWKLIPPGSKVPS